MSSYCKKSISYNKKKERNVELYFFADVTSVAGLLANETHGLATIVLCFIYFSFQTRFNGKWKIQFAIYNL